MGKPRDNEGRGKKKKEQLTTSRKRMRAFSDRCSSVSLLRQEANASSAWIISRMESMESILLDSARRFQLVESRPSNARNKWSNAERIPRRIREVYPVIFKGFISGRVAPSASLSRGSACTSDITSPFRSSFVKPAQ